MKTIRDFLYRFPRFTANCRMDFIHGDAVTLGVCTNLSQSGLRGTFAEPIQSGSEGQLTLYFGEKSVEVLARIDSVRESESRVRFHFKTEDERDAVSELIKLITKGTKR